jgi:hypothetical protein
MLRDADFQVRSTAAEVLGRIRPKAGEPVPALIETLQDPDGLVRWFSADSLALIGAAAEPDVRQKAVRALVLAQKKEPQGAASSAIRIALKMLETAAAREATEPLH